MCGVHVQLCLQLGFDNVIVCIYPNKIQTKMLMYDTYYNRYFVTFVDDYSRTTWLYLMENCSELFSFFRAFYVETHSISYFFSKLEK